MKGTAVSVKITESGILGTIIEGPYTSPGGDVRVLVNLDDGDIPTEFGIDEIQEVQ